MNFTKKDKLIQKSLFELENKNENPNESFENDFIVSSSNQDAFNYIKSWPNWIGGNFTLLIGDKESGKSSLAKIWQKTSNATSIDSDNIKYFEELLTLKNPILIDNIEKLTPKYDSILVQIYNNLLTINLSILITSANNTEELLSSLDLKSRLNCFHAINIKNPDEDLLRALIIKRFSEYQIICTKPLTDKIIKNTNRSFAGINFFIESLIKNLTENNVKINLKNVGLYIKNNFSPDIN